MPNSNANWSLRGGEVALDQLTEVELRQTLLQIPEDQLDSYEVQQGNSPWHPARGVLELYRELARNGVYVRIDRVVQGPFTVQRGLELIDRMERKLDRVRAKVGRDSPWLSIPEFRQSLKQSNDQGSSLAKSGQTGEPLEDDVVAAIPFDPPQTSSTIPSHDEGEIVAAIPYVAPITHDSPSIPTVPSTSALGTQDQSIAARSPSPATPLASVPASSGQSTHHQPAKVRRRLDSNPFSLERLTVAHWACVGVAMAGLLLIGFFLFAGGGDPVAADVGNNQLVSSSSAEPSQPPDVPEGFLFRPEFITTMGDSEAGSAFAANLIAGGPAMLISSLHLLGTAGGFDRDLVGHEVPSRWTSVRLEDCVSGAKIGTVTGNPFRLPHARSLPHVSLHGDVIAFRPDPSQPSRPAFAPKRLADKRCSKGDSVWLVSALVDGEGLTHHATVLGEQDGWLVYQYDQPLEIRATSGAAIVNRNNEVVAVNAGAGEQDGATLGFGTPVWKFRRALADQQYSN